MLKITVYIVDGFYIDEFNCPSIVDITYNNFHIPDIKVSEVFEFQLSFYGWGFLMSESRECLESPGTNIKETLHHKKGLITNL